MLELLILLVGDDEVYQSKAILDCITIEIKPVIAKSSFEICILYTG